MKRGWQLIVLESPARSTKTIFVSIWAVVGLGAIGLTIVIGSFWVGWSLARGGSPARGISLRQALASPTSKQPPQLSPIHSGSLTDGAPESVETEKEQGRDDVIAEAKARAIELGLGTHRVASQLLKGRVERRWSEAAGGDRPLPGTLLWPSLLGWGGRGFGSGEEGYHQAIDIVAEHGSEILAAASGIVGFAGEMRGYGKVVIIIHRGGWVTMYAHNSENIAVTGQQVERGELIGRVGNTGISRGAHIHFEFIADGQNCDPAVILRPGLMLRSGRPDRHDQSEWTIAGERPDGVICEDRRMHPRSRWLHHPQVDAGPDGALQKSLPSLRALPD